MIVFFNIFLIFLYVFVLSVQLLFAGLQLCDGFITRVQYPFETPAFHSGKSIDKGPERNSLKEGKRLTLYMLLQQVKKHPHKVVVYFRFLSFCA